MGKAWKERESKVAKFFGGQRTPLSGANSRHTSADVIHDRLFIEQKHRKKHAVIGVWDKARAQARKEGKIPVVTLTEHNRPGFWVVIHSDDLVEVSWQRGRAIEREEYRIEWESNDA